jgi:hypothetical protein
MAELIRHPNHQFWPDALSLLTVSGVDPSRLLEAGQVRFHPRASQLTEELPRFPKGSKDLVDAFGHGALWLETRYWRGLGIKRDPLPMLLTR